MTLRLAGYSGPPALRTIGGALMVQRAELESGSEAYGQFCYRWWRSETDDGRLGRSRVAVWQGSVPDQRRAPLFDVESQISAGVQNEIRSGAELKEIA